jgi:diacylglycerol kinase (ATP)
MSLNPNLKYKLIFNPKAGVKRGFLFHRDSNYYLEQVQYLLKKYQIDADFAPTRKTGHAIELAREAVKDGYDVVLVAGGDGTVGEVANGLIGTKVVLGILPLGSFMNIARMLSIPNDLERAVMLLKLGRVRKIDVGKVVNIGGQDLEEGYYFLESAGIGLEAQGHEYIQRLEKGEISAFFKMIKSFWDFYMYSADLDLDDKKIYAKASAIVIGNGQLIGPGLPLATKAQLNDHLLTVSIYKMTKYELLRFIISLLTGKKYLTKKIEILQGKKLILQTPFPRLVHADARLYGKTPLICQIEPSALSVIAGFPDAGENFLKNTTPLQP